MFLAGGSRCSLEHPSFRTILAVDIERSGRRQFTDPVRVQMRTLDTWAADLLGQAGAGKQGAADDARAVLSSLPPGSFVEAVQPALALLASGHTDQATEHLDQLLAGIRARTARSLATADLAVLLVDLGYPRMRCPPG